jgi:hypothetical protein
LEGHLEIADSEYVLHICCYHCVFIYTLNIVGTHTIASSPSLPLPLTVEGFLEQLKLQRYWDVFKDNGFEELNMLKYLDANTLKEMGKLLENAGDYAHTVKFVNVCLNADL